MPSRAVGVTDTAPSTSVADVAVVEMPMLDLVTTTTADPGTSGTTLALTNGSTKFPGSGSFKIRVENELMLVTGGQGTNSWTVTRGIDGTANVAHASGVSVYYVAGVQQVMPTPDRVVTYQGALAAFRTLGNAASGQNLLTIENGSSSKVNIAVRRLALEMDATAVLTAVAPDVKVARTTGLPTGGTVLTKAAIDPSLSSDSNVVVRGATASDGGAATAITATLAATLWHQFTMRLHTAVGQVLTDDMNLLPLLVDTDPLIITPGNAIAVQIVGTAASNAATNHYVPKLFWEEYLVP